MVYLKFSYIFTFLLFSVSCIAVSCFATFPTKTFPSLYNRITYQAFVTSLKASHKVTIKHEGKDTVLEIGEDTSILDAALDAGIELPYDCKLGTYTSFPLSFIFMVYPWYSYPNNFRYIYIGVCLTCPSRVLSGDVDQSQGTLDDSVIEAGYALTCITFPRSDCVVTSIDEDELVNAQFER